AWGQGAELAGGGEAGATGEPSESRRQKIQIRAVGRMPVPARSAGRLGPARRHRGRHAGRVAREFSSRSDCLPPLERRLRREFERRRSSAGSAGATKFWGWLGGGRRGPLR